MKLTVTLALFALLLIPAAGLAQKSPAAEVYVGFPMLFRDSSSQLFGVHGNFSANLEPWFGLAGDGAFHAGEVYAEKSLFTGLGGPVFSANVGNRWRFFGSALIGAAVSGCAQFENGCHTGASFSSALRGGVQFRPRSRTSLRISADSLTTNFRAVNQRYARLSFGVVFPIGK